jgi:Mn2+/Fe2+ NRAMP family transporter
MLYKRHLREGYSLIWLLGVFTLLVLSVFRGLLTRMADFLGISYAPSLLFAVSLIFITMIMLSFAVSITNLVRRNRDLAQKLALLEWYIQQLSLGSKTKGPVEHKLTLEDEHFNDVLTAIKDSEVKR